MSPESDVAIVGLGLIGGSLARALMERGIRVAGTTTSEADASAAQDAGITVTRGAEAVRAVTAGAEIIVIATPLDVIATVARDITDGKSPGALVLHVAGLQSARALRIDDAVASAVLGTHPMAGTHETGFVASRADLFQNAVVSAEARADADSRRRIEGLWAAAGAAQVVYRSAEEHDALMSWLSHLPQLASTALAAAVADRGMALADGGPGLRDVTRLAESPFSIWQPILAASPREIAVALEALEGRLADVRHAIERSEWKELDTLWQTARRWRALGKRQ